MKILLTTLHSKYIHASLALPYLKAFCQSVDGVDLFIREFTINEPKEVVLADILESAPDVVCFSVYLWNRLAILELVDCLNQVDPAIRIVLGGPEVSFEEADFFRCHPVTAIVRGEGELPLRHLLTAWAGGQEPASCAGLQLAEQEPPRQNSLLESLDAIPSPFAAGLVDLSKPLVYYESSRGCPYSCSFCMSSLDDRVRSFSMTRIKADLLFLMQNRVKLIKFVDRTFNYSNRRSRDIFRFILEHNQGSQFHFEIGAHLLDQETLELLATVPDHVFQFEIGVQSTLPKTLQQISRQASLDALAQNVRWLCQHTRIHLHLDLIAGLPGETYQEFLHSLDWTNALGAGHLQVEPVKLLPGVPLRREAEKWGICFDPAPMYTILHSATMSYADLERLRGMGRLLDLLCNSHRFTHVIGYLSTRFSSFSALLEELDNYWRSRGLYRQSCSARSLYEHLDQFIWSYCHEVAEIAREHLARDFALHERVVSGSEPAFFVNRLNESEQQLVRSRFKEELEAKERSGKVQYYAAVFKHLVADKERSVFLYIYRTHTRSGMEAEELEIL